MQEKAYPSKQLSNHPDLTKEVVDKFDYHFLGRQDRYQYIFSYDNGYTVSVITGYGAYGNVEAPYELGLMYEGLGLISLEGVTDDHEPISAYNTLDEVLSKLEIVKSKKDDAE